MSEPTEDLRPWGYAPGGYRFTCTDCGPKSFIDSPMAGKYSSRCRDHAIQARDAAVAALQATKPPKAGEPATSLLMERALRLGDRVRAGEPVPPEEVSAFLIETVEQCEADAKRMAGTIVAAKIMLRRGNSQEALEILESAANAR